MSNDQVITVSEAVHKLQLALLDGIRDETQLFAAGSMMSKSDYQDIVTERTISNLCGYPLCPNALPLERSRKGHYRISLKEHKVYDLHETYMYCSSRCLISSRAFGGSLQEERCAVLNPAKINEVLRLFENLGVESEEVGNNGDLGLSKLKIQEKIDAKGVKVPMEEWIGPSNAIEGYVPRHDRNMKLLSSKAMNNGSEQNGMVQNNVDFKVDVLPSEDIAGPRKAPMKGEKSNTNQSRASTPFFNEMDFMSTIITSDEYTVSKLDGDSNLIHSNIAKEGSTPQKKFVSKKGKEPIFNDMDFMSTIITGDEYNIFKPASNQSISETNQMQKEFTGKLTIEEAETQPKSLKTNSAENDLQSSKDSTARGIGSTTNDIPGIASLSHHSSNDVNSCTIQVVDEYHPEQAGQSSITTVKSSLKTSGSQKASRSVTWADNKNNFSDAGNLCEFREFKNTEEGSSTVNRRDIEDNDDFERFELAEACAAALTQAAEAVASGQSHITDAVSEAGIVVLPKPQQADEGKDLTEDDPFTETTSSKWPMKPGDSNSDFLDSNDSWFDTPPESFNLTLSPFANIWNALFSWMTSSSLAYIYGRDESFQEDYLSVNGREYPHRVVLPDGRSSEIRQTLAGCLSRALPGVITVLKLPTPVSTLEQGLTCLIGTMSFIEALPPFRLKQWQVIVLLFIDALSICRIPGLTPLLTSRRILFHKVLDGAQLAPEDYDIMREFVIPLGRVPQFSMQSGG